MAPQAASTKGMDKPSQTLSIFQQAKTPFVHQPDGTGKTLTFLVPILDTILKQKQQDNNRKVKGEGQQTAGRRGAVIVTLNKELVLQCYKEIRLLDFKNLLNVNRSGSIIHYSPVIEEMSKPKEEQNHDTIMKMMEENVAKSIQWPQTDILVSTPSTLGKILQQKRNTQIVYRPSIVALDEADLLLLGRTSSHHIANNHRLLTQTTDNKSASNAQSAHDKQTGSISQSLRYILAAPTDRFMRQGLKQTEVCLSSLGPLTSTGYCTEQLSIEGVKASFKVVQGDSKAQILENKLKRLQQLMQDNSGKATVVFCSSQNLRKVHEMLANRLGRQVVDYYADLNTEKRMWAVSDFNSSNADCFLSTELGSRGLTFTRPIELMVSLDICKIFEDELIRMGRLNQSASHYCMLGTQLERQSIMKMCKKETSKAETIQQQLQNRTAGSKSQEGLIKYYSKILSQI